MSMTKLHFPDGTIEEWDPGTAYLIWLNLPGCALRTYGDNRPVEPGEFKASGELAGGDYGAFPGGRWTE
jgi:hypothetical protein